jgi:hypothetical protein
MKERETDEIKYLDNERGLWQETHSFIYETDIRCRVKDSERIPEECE